jgi:surfeit locus 1 family protein
MAKAGLFTPKWILTTLLAIVAVGVMIRLGIWQLDRLAWRRAFNSRVTAQVTQPVLNLNQNIPVESLYDMEYRGATVIGIFDPSQAILLRNQVWQDQTGYRLMEPLKILHRSDSVLIDRGWIPLQDAHHLEKFEISGDVTIHGQIRRPQTHPDFGGVPDPTLSPYETRLDAWNIVNLDRIQQQVNYPLLPVYIQEAPSDLAGNSPPYASLSEVEITEGPHAGYAIQWFSFAAILAVGYPFYLRHQIELKR